MKMFIRPLAFATILGAGALLGTGHITADTPPGGAGAKLAEPPKEAPKAPAADPIAPVKITDAKTSLKTAVDPKPLSPAVKKALAYLVKNQQEDGGWNQGGGWRTQVGNAPGGGRVEGKNVEDPSDVGNTCFALLALFRAGHTPANGEYKENVIKGLKFVLTRVEKADKDSLYVTDVRNTQLQSKIGPFVDTFLVNLVLAEMRGFGGTEEKRLISALEKTMNKIVKHQDVNGGFANNGGWAPTLSVGIANKSFARAKQNGVEFDQKVLDRAMAQSKGAAEGKGMAGGKPASDSFALGAAPAAGFTGRSGAGGFGGGDAGVRLYSLGQGAGNSQDLYNSLKADGKKAEQVLKDSKATKDEREKAQKKVDEVRKAETDNDKVQTDLAKTVKDDKFVAGFGSNGGEEFLSFMNISESLLIKGGKDWTDWDAKMTAGLEKAQDKDGSWSGQHCITGRTFCTSAALLVLMADRTQFPVDVLKK